MSSSSFYNQNTPVYTDTNPAGPADTPVSGSPPPAPSSFFGGTGQPYANIETVQATYADMVAADAAAAASAAAASTSQTNAAASAALALASQNAAATSATNASTSATGAAASQSAASTSATNAANSATAASTSATSASGSATAASTSATNASTSATNAASSASAASTSATNAANSATAAATSATNAAASADTEIAARAVRYDAAQTLTSGQKTQAQSNMGLGTAAPLNVGTGANNVVQLDGTAKLPAVDGSQITNLPAASFHGQCFLSKSGTTLLLAPKNGNKLLINSVQQTIPDAGVTLAAPATTLTLYYIYAYMSSGTLTLEAATTAHAPQAGTGVEIKSGDATRTLVGMARTVSSAWVDSASQRFVRSYFNRHAIGLNTTSTTSRTTASTSLVEVSTDFRAEFLIWSDETASATVAGTYFSSGASIGCVSALGFNGTSPENAVVEYATVNSGFEDGFSATSVKTGLTEGYNYVTLLGRTNGASTITWEYNAGIAQTGLSARIGA